MIALASDHGGYRLKELIKTWLAQKGIEFNDLGCEGSASVDYPDYARAVGASVAEGRAEKGILVCGTGIGMSMAANKIPGVRAALVHDAYTARMSREHNDANVLCIGGRVLGDEVARDILFLWISTPFEGGRLSLIHI